MYPREKKFSFKTINRYFHAHEKTLTDLDKIFTHSKLPLPMLCDPCLVSKKGTKAKSSIVITNQDRDTNRDMNSSERLRGVWHSSIKAK